MLSYQGGASYSALVPFSPMLLKTVKKITCFKNCPCQGIMEVSSLTDKSPLQCFLQCYFNDHLKGLNVIFQQCVHLWVLNN